MPQPIIFKSEPKALNSNKVQFRPDFLEKTGPNGGRIVIDTLLLVASLQIDVTVGAFNGEDAPRAFPKISVKQKDGVLRYNEVPGDALRNFLYEMIDPARIKEHADVAVGNNQAVIWTMPVPLAKEFVHEGPDYAMAAELLEFIEISCTNAAELSVGGATVAIDSGEYWVVAECHEEVDVVQHAVDEIKVSEFQTATETELTTDGRLQELVLMVRGAEGGASLANVTEAWLSQPLYSAPQLRVLPDLQDRYSRIRRTAPGAHGTQGDPVRKNPFLTATPRAIAVLMADKTKCWEQPERQSVHVKTTQSASPGTLLAIARIAKPRSMETFNSIRKKYKLRGEFRVKTASNSRRDARDWPEDQLRYMPIKFTG